MIIKGILRKLFFRYLPESSLKDRLRCFWYNHFERNKFKIYYKKNYFLISFDSPYNLSLKFYDNPYYWNWHTNDGYLAKYFPQKGDIVIDAGAYVGTFTLVASRLVGQQGRVIAFEPDPQNYNKLLQNIKHNEANNVTVVNKGLWSKDTILKGDSARSGTVSFRVGDDIDDSSMTVEVVSLDNELERLNIHKVDFIKMDIEGAELAALEGAIKTLTSNNLQLAIASYHVVDGQQTFMKLEEQLGQLGYKTETAFPPWLVTYAWK